jgi:beta-glucanase (GH16 family)
MAQLCAGTQVILLDRELNDGNNWQLEFEDDFNASSLDLSKWELQVAYQGAPDGSGAYLTLDNVKVSADTYTAKSTSATGFCQVALRKETVTRPITFWDPNSPSKTYNYTGATIWSKPQFGWGKYEIRCKIPKGKGLWSSAYMYGEQSGAGNEIDLFEITDEKDLLGRYDPDKLSKVVQAHYHFWDKTSSINGIDHNCGNSSGNQNNMDYSLDFHTYTLIWDRWGISWLIDGKLINKVCQWYDPNGNYITKDNIKPSQVAVRNDWYPTLPMSFIFGLSQGKDDADDATSLPGFLIVDYVRYYKPY